MVVADAVVCQANASAREALVAGEGSDDDNTMYIPCTLCAWRVVE